MLFIGLIPSLLVRLPILAMSLSSRTSSISLPSSGESERRRLLRFDEFEGPAIDDGAIVTALDGSLNGDNEEEEAEVLA